MDIGVVEVNTVLVLIVEGARAGSVSLLFAFVRLERVHLVAFLALGLRLGDFDFTIIDSVSDSLFASLCCFLVCCLLGILGIGIRSAGLLHVLRTEIDELLTKVDLFAVRVNFESLELLHFPFFLLLISLFAPFLLPGFVLIILSLTFLS